MILPFWLPPNPTTPPGLSSSSWNICISPVMCREHPLSRYHDWCLNGAVKDICKINDSVLRYPLSGSFLVSLSRSLEDSGNFCLRIVMCYLGMRLSPTGLILLLGLFLTTLRVNRFRTSDMCARGNKMLIKRLWLRVQSFMLPIRF